MIKKITFFSITWLFLQIIKRDDFGLDIVHVSFLDDVPQSTSYNYSFRKKLGLRLATIFGCCLSNKPLHISKADTNFLLVDLEQG